jgi:hypothetical protein
MHPGSVFYPSFELRRLRMLLKRFLMYMIVCRRSEFFVIVVESSFKYHLKAPFEFFLCLAVYRSLLFLLNQKEMQMHSCSRTVLLVP